MSTAPASVSDFEFDGLFDRDVVIESDEIVSYADGERLGFGPGDAANAPEGRDGQRVELIVQGTLKANGAGGGRILFESGADDPAAGDWAGLRFELSGSERPGYGYLGCDVEPSALESVTISDCVVPITIGDHCAPGLADVDWNRISDLPERVIQSARGGGTFAFQLGRGRARERGSASGPCVRRKARALLGTPFGGCLALRFRVGLRRFLDH